MPGQFAPKANWQRYKRPLMIRILTLVLFFCSSLSWAQVPGETSKIIKEENNDFPLTAAGSLEYEKKMNNNINAIAALTPEHYVRDIEQYRIAFDKFVEYKKRVCQGEFSTAVLGGQFKGNAQKKLSASERKTCFKQIKNLQMNMINSTYMARKRYLEYVHNLRLSELASSRERLLKDLEESFNR